MSCTGEGFDREARVEELKHTKSFLEKWLHPVSAIVSGASVGALLISLGIGGAPVVLGTAAFGMSSYFALKVFGILSACAAGAEETRREEIERLRTASIDKASELKAESNDWQRVQRYVAIHVDKALSVKLGEEISLPIEEFVDLCKTGSYDCAGAEKIIRNSLKLQHLDAEVIGSMPLPETLEGYARSAFCLFILVRMIACAGLSREQCFTIIAPSVRLIARVKDCHQEEVCKIIKTLQDNQFSGVNNYSSNFDPDGIDTICKDAWDSFLNIVRVNKICIDHGSFVERIKIEFAYTPESDYFVAEVSSAMRWTAREFQLKQGKL